MYEIVFNPSFSVKGPRFPLQPSSPFSRPIPLRCSGPNRVGASTQRTPTAPAPSPCTPVCGAMVCLVEKKFDPPPCGGGEGVIPQTKIPPSPPHPGVT